MRLSIPDNFKKAVAKMPCDDVTIWSMPAYKSPATNPTFMPFRMKFDVKSNSMKLIEEPTGSIAVKRKLKKLQPQILKDFSEGIRYSMLTAKSFSEPVLFGRRISSWTIEAWVSIKGDAAQEVVLMDIWTSGFKDFESTYSMSEKVIMLEDIKRVVNLHAMAINCSVIQLVDEDSSFEILAAIDGMTAEVKCEFGVVRTTSIGESMSYMKSRV